MTCTKDNKDNKDVVEELETENEENLLELVESKDKEIRELSDTLLRLQADFINYRKRTEKEKGSLISYGIESLVCDLLPAIDSLEKALEIESAKDTEDSFYEGIEMIYTQIQNVLKKNGVIEIESLGEAFDPNYHDAILMEESTEYEEGLITYVLQKGYMLKEKVIRPTMVKVAK